MVANILVVVLAACLFDNQTEQQETVIAVFPAAAGIEGETSLPIELDVVLERAQFKSVLIELWAEEIAGAAGVSEKLVNGYFGGQVFVGIVREIFA